MKKEVEVVLTVLNQAAEAAYSVQVFDWSGGKGRLKERDTANLISSLRGTLVTDVDFGRMTI